MESAGLMLRPHPEEPRSGVSKDGNAVLSPSFETREERAPQDEVSQLFDKRNLNEVICLSSPVPFAKIFWFTSEANHLFIRRHPGPHKGAFRDRHERRAEDAMDASGAKDESVTLRTAKSCGSDVSTLTSSWR
jgi:hypothetical protein